MEWIIILSIGLVVLGLIGCFLPVIPGAPLAWAALLLIHYTDTYHFTTTFLVITAVITILVELLDYFLPIWLTKYSGGTKHGQRGALIGMLLGLVFGGPIGLIIGPILGAFIGELLHNAKDFRKAKRAASYSLLGFFITTGLGLLWCGILAYYVVKSLPWSEW